MSATEKKIISVIPSGRSRPIKITLDPEFASLIAPLGPAEYAQLEASIRESGEPLVIPIAGTDTRPGARFSKLNGRGFMI